MAIMHAVWPVSALYGGICVLVTYLRRAEEPFAAAVAISSCSISDMR